MSKHHKLKQPTQYPYWFKTTITLFGLILLFVIMSYGKFILMPLAFAAFLAMLLSPVVNKLESWKLGRAFSIIITILMVLVIFAGLISLISAQFVQFAERVPEVTNRLQVVANESIEFLEEKVGISQEQQTDYLRRGIGDLLARIRGFIGGLIGATSSAVTLMTLLPIFVFFLLYYRRMYQNFFHAIFSKSDERSNVDDVLDNVQDVSQNYLWFVNSDGYFSHLKYNRTNDYWLRPCGFLVYLLINIVIPLRNYNWSFTTPFVCSIVGRFHIYTSFCTHRIWNRSILRGKFYISHSRVKVAINPFMAMLALIVGGEIWGISGMILFVPLIGILRVIFEEIPELKPYGYLLGNRIEYDKTDSIK